MYYTTDGGLKTPDKAEAKACMSLDLKSPCADLSLEPPTPQTPADIRAKLEFNRDGKNDYTITLYKSIIIQCPVRSLYEYNLSQFFFSMQIL